MTPAQQTVRAASLTLPFLCFKTSICVLKDATEEKVRFISTSVAHGRDRVVTEQKTTLNSTHPANDSHYSE